MDIVLAAGGEVLGGVNFFQLAVENPVMVQCSIVGKLKWRAGLPRQPMDVVEFDLPEFSAPRKFRLVTRDDTALEGVDFVAAEYGDHVWDDQPYYIDPGRGGDSAWLLAVDDHVTLTDDAPSRPRPRPSALASSPSSRAA
jgi:hypothetical protein